MVILRHCSRTQSELSLLKTGPIRCRVQRSGDSTYSPLNSSSNFSDKPDSYVDAENKDYGAELFVNGGIVQRSPERQRRVEPEPQRAQDRPRYNDRTRYVRCRENQC
uniref:Uncharacterized protein n=1 Tax=Nelumbo nucifera TaxID=4432 RepID=A0A822YFH6_NELNU|nr:TPA_asm: hypothetical protein HUJ06_031183 [Nelumbo nucifera]